MQLTPSHLSPNNTWQIGTGDDTRAYSDVFLKYGVALVGPGDQGPAGSAAADAHHSQKENGKNWGAELSKVKTGEWFIARKGRRAIIAVGLVEKGYDYSHKFDDVECWDLQHYIKVKWYTPASGPTFLDGTPLGMSTMERCNHTAVFEKIYQTEWIEHPATATVESIPEPEPLEMEHLMAALIDHGIRISDAENISTTIRRLVILMKWYQKNDPAVLEREIVAFMVLPLLTALGWSEQKIKLEYKYIDIALFHQAFKGNYETIPEIIIEVKTFSNGLAFTDEQVKGYAGKFPSCKKFVVTNGYCYQYFEREGEHLVPKGRFNLLKFRRHHVLKNLPLDALETVLAISNLG